MGSCLSSPDKEPAAHELPRSAGKPESNSTTSSGDQPANKRASHHTVNGVANGASLDSNQSAPAHHKPSIASSTTSSTKRNKRSSGKGIMNGGDVSEEAAKSNEQADGKQEIKVLLLGSGESGKSTVLKQMKIIHQNGYSQQERFDLRVHIYSNVIESAKEVVKALKDMNVILDEPLDESIYEAIEKATPPPYPQDFDESLAVKIRTMWANPGVQSFVTENRGRYFYLMDSAEYFFNNVTRIGTPGYIPDISDILRSRVKTTGIYDTEFDMGGLKIHMYDLGGQRSERKKWIHCFNNVTLIIFCVALSEYDQSLQEDSSQNRLMESISLFRQLINSKWFTRTSVVLFLNKIDVFADKLPSSPLENIFPDYTGGPNVSAAAKYILELFKAQNEANLNMYYHLTQATDTSNIKIVFGAVKETILLNALKDTTLL